MKDKSVNTSVLSLFSLTGKRERILVSHKNEGYIVLPEIPVKAIAGCNLKQLMNFFINAAYKILLVVFTGIKLSEDLSELCDDTVLSEFTVHYQS